ncbi:MAG TPA: SagB/ThcOx family dehydrogenase [bacterium]|nr:SagB/ThcOx family dehydrogenase [bacterium]
MKLSKRNALLFMAVICAAVICWAHQGACAEEAVIKLSDPQYTRGKLLMEALKERKTSRAFSGKELSDELLSNLLWAAAGVNRPDSGKRTAPTAVNWQEIDIYVALKSGLYLYDAPSHSLKPVLAKDIRESVGMQPFVKEAPVGLIFVADFAKMAGAYQPSDEDKKFYSATDTGYISQNVYLFCASEGLATVALGMVDRPSLAAIMKLRPEQRIILSQPVGYPKGEK